MKVYRLTTQVQSTKTIQYIVEAETRAEAQKKIVEGQERGEGEEIDDDIDWSTETVSELKFIEEIDQANKVEEHIFRINKNISYENDKSNKQH